MAHRASGLALRVLAGTVPILLAFALLRLWVGRSIGDYLPVVSDELSYWHQVVTFAHVGFDNGFYTYQEETATIPSAYGPWGPAFPVLYGVPVALFGVSSRYAVLGLNLALFVVLMVAALSVARATRRQSIYIGLTVAAFPSVLLYLPGGMQEPLHLVIGVVLAAGFHRLLTAAPDARRRVAGGLCALITVVALLRPTWGFLLVPAALLGARGVGRRSAITAVAAALTGAAALSALFPLWAAPYPYGPSYQIRHGATLGVKLDLLVGNLKRNVRLLVEPDGWVLRVGPAQFYLLVLIGAAALAVVVWAVRRRRDSPLYLAITVASALLLPLAFVFVVYGIDNSTRALGPHTLFAAVLLCLARPRQLLVIPIAVFVLNIASTPWLKSDFVGYNKLNYRADSATVAELRSVFAAHLRFRPGANRWCNTLLHSSDAPFIYQLAAVPPGFGISVDMNQRFAGPIRSAYVLVKPEDVGRLPQRGSGLQPIAVTPYGTLHRNSNSPCFTRS